MNTPSPTPSKRRATASQREFSEQDPTQKALPMTEDLQWEAVRTRNKQFDGSFFYSVKSTGIYCRPTCPSRLPRRANVSFHATQEAAEHAGFRPCKRCKPKLLPQASEGSARVEKVCRFIEANNKIPTLEALAKHIGISPYHLQRTFKKATGLTPKQYGRAHRDKRLRESLRDQSSVTEAAFAAGLPSQGSLYENRSGTLGMTPTEFQQGAPNLAIRFAIGQCDLGALLVAETSRGVCCVLLGDEPEDLTGDLQARFPLAQLAAADNELSNRLAHVAGWIERGDTDNALPLDIRGTVFQQKVWLALRNIPAGTTVTYSELAKSIGAPKSARAVAGACAANPIAVAIPCHRVIRSDGGLSGYRWGLERKRTLLEREASQ